MEARRVRRALRGSSSSHGGQLTSPRKNLLPPRSFNGDSSGHAILPKHPDSLLPKGPLLSSHRLPLLLTIFFNLYLTTPLQLKDRKSTRLNSSHANISYA